MHNAAGIPEHTVVIDVAISNYLVVSVFQHDVSLPTRFTYLAGSEALNQVRRVKLLIYVGILTGINLLGIGSFYLIKSNFAGNSGVVVSYTLSTPGQIGIYNLSFENPIMYGDPSGC